MKAYRGKDGKIRLFRWEKNWKRMQNSARGILMEPVPKALFKEMIVEVVNRNKEFVPPHGTGAALYIRPLLYGSGAEVGVKPASEYTFVVFVTPVGPYFKEGFNPVKIAIVRDTDRAAPQGTGTLKVGGNYAASLRGVQKVKNKGYSSPLYLDAKEKKYIDEIGAANFFGIKNNTYITPKSPSISLLRLVKSRTLIQEKSTITARMANPEKFPHNCTTPSSTYNTAMKKIRLGGLRLLDKEDLRPETEVGFKLRSSAFGLPSNLLVLLQILCK
jgi:branched-chain amino acid aminotransferase